MLSMFKFLLIDVRNLLDQVVVVAASIQYPGRNSLA
jgi:hypothetical protein